MLSVRCFIVNQGKTLDISVSGFISTSSIVLYWEKILQAKQYWKKRCMLWFFESHRKYSMNIYIL